MPVAVKKTVKFLKLSYLWVVRILFAPNHFNVPMWRRLYLAFAGGFVPDQGRALRFAAPPKVRVSLRVRLVPLTIHQ